MPEIHDITNEAGYRVRVSVPKGRSIKMGIPLSVDFEALAEQFDLEAETAQAIQRIIWDTRIITPRDFRRGEAYDALYSAVRNTFPHLERKQAAKLGTSIVNRVRSNLA